MPKATRPPSICPVATAEGRYRCQHAVMMLRSLMTQQDSTCCHGRRRAIAEGISHRADGAACWAQARLHARMRTDASRHARPHAPRRTWHALMDASKSNASAQNMSFTARARNGGGQSRSPLSPHSLTRPSCLMPHAQHGGAGTQPSPYATLIATASKADTVDGGAGGSAPWPPHLRPWRRA